MLLNDGTSWDYLRFVNQLKINIFSDVILIQPKTCLLKIQPISAIQDILLEHRSIYGYFPGQIV